MTNDALKEWPGSRRPDQGGARREIDVLQIGEVVGPCGQGEGEGRESDLVLDIGAGLEPVVGIGTDGEIEGVVADVAAEGHEMAAAEEIAPPGIDVVDPVFEVDPERVEVGIDGEQARRLSR